MKETERLRPFCAGCLLLILLTACTTPKATNKPTGVYELSEPQPLINQGTRTYWWSPTQTQVLFNWQIPNAGSPGFLPDGPLLILNLPDGVTHLLPREGSVPLWSPDGESILFRSGTPLDGTLQLWQYTPATEKLQPLQFSPFGMPTQWLNSGQLLYATANELWKGRLDPATNRLIAPTLWLDLKRMDLGTVPWQITSPAGNAVVFLSGRKEQSTEPAQRNRHSLWLIKPVPKDQGEAAPQLLTTAPDGIGFCCRWSADGRFFAFAAFAPDNGIYLVDLHGNSRPSLLVPAAALGQGHFISMDFAPDAQHVVFEWAPVGDGFPFAETELYLVSLPATSDADRSATPQRLTTPGSGSHNWVRWSSQGNYLSFQPESDPAGRTWITHLTAVGSAEEMKTPKTVNVTLAMPIASATVRAQETAIDLAPGFRRTNEGYCPSGAPLAPPVPWQNEQHAQERYRQEMATIFLHETPVGWSDQNIPLRRWQAAEVDLLLSSLLRRGERYVGIQVGYRAPQQEQRPMSMTALTPGLYLHGMAADLIAPVTVRAPFAVVKTETGITCWPPEVTTVNQSPAILLRQATALADHDAYNALIWREGGIYWRLSARDVSAGGAYSADDLRQIAEEELETYNPEEKRWQPQKPTNP